MDAHLSGRRALVTGASGASGRAVVARLQAGGCEVIATGRDPSRLPEGAFAGDLMRPEAVEFLLAYVKAFGDPDIVVHVLGGSGGAKATTLPSEEWARAWRLNLGIAIDLNNAFLPAMLARGWGRIVHFSSNGVKLAIGNAPYTSAKAAVEGYVRSVGREVAARGVVVSAVAPGPIDNGVGYLYRQGPAWTEEFMRNYVPMRRWGRPEEIAAAVAFLCSDAASYMAGAVMEVDGGMR